MKDKNIIKTNIKDGACIIIRDEFELIGPYWIVLYVSYENI